MRRVLGVIVGVGWPLARTVLPPVAAARVGQSLADEPRPIGGEPFLERFGLRERGRRPAVDALVDYLDARKQAPNRFELRLKVGYPALECRHAVGIGGAVVRFGARLGGVGVVTGSGVGRRRFGRCRVSRHTGGGGGITQEHSDRTLNSQPPNTCV